MNTAAFAKPTADEILAASETALNAAANSNDANSDMDHNFVFPVPDNAPLPPSSHPKLGKPTYRWSYRDTAGSILCYVNRYDLIEDSCPKKVVITMLVTRLPDGKLQWVYKGMPAPRPLYNLHLITANQDATIIVAEGEKAADAAAQLFPGMVATTSMSGSNAAHKTDWTPINGRHVVISPDADAAGKKYADRVIELCLTAGAASISVLPPERLGRLIVADGKPVTREGEIPVGYDLADAQVDGWTASHVAEAMVGDTGFFIPQAPKAAASPVPYVPAGFKIDRHGVWKGTESKEGQMQWSLMSSHLEVVALVRDFDSQGWQMMLALVDHDGIRHEILLPMAALAAEGAALREKLLGLGLRLTPHAWARVALLEYLSSASPTRRIRCVDRLGWHDKSYVMQGATYGAAQTDEVMFRETGSPKEQVTKAAGVLADWQDTVARYAVGNSRLVLALCVAFAAPLLNLVGAEGGGIHFYGGSSVGKTLLLVIAGSVWGGGRARGYVDSWRMTDNSAEGLARSRCDGILALDELAEVHATAFGALCYMLANGQGKGRATRNGEHRQAGQWRLLFLSTGEITMETKLQEMGGRVMAGMQTRFVELNADAGAGHGVFENLHGYATGREFYHHIDAAAKRTYGTAIREFLTHISADTEETAAAVLEYQDAFLRKFCPADADPQVERVAKRFSLFAAAGQMATSMGILPWPQDEAERGVAVCFQAWLAERGGTGPSELVSAVHQVTSLLERYGASRFDAWHVGGRDFEHINDHAHDRWGWRKIEKVESGETEYFATAAGFDELCKGFDRSRVVKELIRIGMLVPGRDGKSAQAVSIPGHKKIRCYRLIPSRVAEQVSEETSHDE